jgi:hypothetical protein
MKKYVPVRGQPPSPAEMGARANIGVASPDDIYNRLTRLEDPPAYFPRGKHSLVLPRHRADYLHQLREMRANPINHGWCDTAKGWVVNFRNDRDAIIGRLAYDES